MVPTVMVVIRLARAGKRKNPFYHLSVSDKRNPRDGRFIERVGYYNPIARGDDVRTWVNLERADYWIGVGAIPSPKVKSIIKSARIAQVAAESQAVDDPAESGVEEAATEEAEEATAEQESDEETVQESVEESVEEETEQDQNQESASSDDDSQGQPE